MYNCIDLSILTPEKCHVYLSIYIYIICMYICMYVYLYVCMYTLLSEREREKERMNERTNEFVCSSLSYVFFFLCLCMHRDTLLLCCAILTS